MVWILIKDLGKDTQVDKYELKLDQINIELKSV